VLLLLLSLSLFALVIHIIYCLVIVIQLFGYTQPQLSVQ